MLNPTDSSSRTPRELSSAEENMVVFLIDRKLGLSTVSTFANVTQDEFPDVESIADERNSLWDEFASLSPDLLRKRYEDERYSFDSDAEIHFKKLSVVQAREWVRKDAWTLDEAIALLLGFVPRSGTRQWSEKNHTYFEPAQKFREMAELTRTAIVAKKLSDPDGPTRFLEWAAGKEIPLHAEFEVQVLGASASSWKERYEHVQSENEKLKTENASLKDEIKKQGSPSHKTLLQLFAVIAIEKYNFKVDAQRNTAIARIAGFAQRHGIEVTGKTLLKWIRSGASDLPNKHGSPFLLEENESPTDGKFQ